MRIYTVLAAAGITAIAAIGAMLVMQASQDTETAPVSAPASLMAYDYTKNDDIEQDLEEMGFSMSSHLKFAETQDIKKYCKLFDDDILQNQIQYCTSTEIRNSQEHFLGNIHMVGTPDNPRLIITVLEASYDEADDVAAIFDAVINNTVCRCWHEHDTGGFESTSTWIHGLADFHKQGLQKTAASAVLNLEGFKIKSEITSIEGSHVWKLFVEG